MIIYYSSNYVLKNVYKSLQTQRTSNDNPSNLLACPAIRDSWHNVFMLELKESFTVNHALDYVKRSNNSKITRNRSPHLEGTNIFNLCSASYFFCEEPLKMKVTAPYFHKADFQKEATFIGGVFDIGKWFRPVQSEIITWKENGEVVFKKEQPLFYVEFLTEEPVELIEFKLTPIIAFLANSLVESPFQNKENMQGSLHSRYEAFEGSDYRLGVIEEIKANLVSEDEASPTV
jgi:hypothetical protein